MPRPWSGGGTPLESVWADWAESCRPWPREAIEPGPWGTWGGGGSDMGLPWWGGGAWSPNWMVRGGPAEGGAPPLASGWAAAAGDGEGALGWGAMGAVKELDPAATAVPEGWGGGGAEAGSLKPPNLMFGVPREAPFGIALVAMEDLRLCRPPL